MSDVAAGDDDPFVRQVDWLVDRVGGKDALVRATGNKVSARTLDNWSRGAYPRSSVTGAVRDLDAWATAQDFGYPGAAGAPRLVDSCGPAAPVGSLPPDAARDAATGTVAGPDRPRRSALVLAAGAVGLVAVTAVVSVVTTLAVVGDPPVAVQEEATAMAALPTSGQDGVTFPELTGSLGSNTFADPRTLADNSVPIPPDTTVEVICRYFSPVVPSVTPDGFWYLVADEEWAGRWAPANTFMNGDVPGGPYTHNTDFAVPVCA